MTAVIYCKTPLEPTPTVHAIVMVTTYIITACVGSVAILTKSSDILNKNSLVVKKVQSRLEAESVCSHGYK